MKKLILFQQERLYWVSVKFFYIHLLAMSVFVFQGIVFFDRESLGWRPIAQSWLESRNQQEVHVRNHYDMYSSDFLSVVIK